MKISQDTEDTIDLKALFFTLLRHWLLILFCVALSLCAALLYLRMTPNTYAVNALVQVEESKGTSAALLGELSSIMEQKQPAQTEIEILKSRLVLGQVIENLYLDIEIKELEKHFWNRLFEDHRLKIAHTPERMSISNNSDFFSISQFEVPKSYLDQNLILEFQAQKFSLKLAKTQQILIQGVINRPQKFKTSAGEWSVAINSSHRQSSGTYLIQKMSLPAAVKKLHANYSVVEKGKLSGILEINYQGEDKQHITQVLNHILSAYHQQNIERRSAETAQTLNFLENRLPQLEQELDEAERAFNVFRERYNTIDVNKESELYLAQSIELESKKIEIEQQYAELSVRYTAEHPVLKQAQAQIISLNKKLGELENTLKRLPDLQRQYLQLYRKVEVKQELYTALLNSYQQLNIAKAGEIGNVRIIDHALEPFEPISPKKLITLVLSLFVGGFLGIALALFRHMVRSGIRDASEIEDNFQLPVYATIPRSKLQQQYAKKTFKSYRSILAVEHPDDLAIESLRSMRTAIHFALAKNNKVIMISGPSPQLGKSFISINLATILAQNNRRVLLIDADLRRGYLHQYFKSIPYPGLTEFLTEQQLLSNLIKTTDINNLDFLSRGSSPKNPAELLSSERFGAMIEELSQYYDHILIDTPPILAVTDAGIIGQHTSANIMIARQMTSNLAELELSVSRFRQAGVEVNGFIFNDIDRSQSSYGYHYNYNYDYKSEPSDNLDKSA